MRPKSLPDRPLDARELAALEVLAAGRALSSSCVAGSLGLPVVAATAICDRLCRVGLAQAAAGDERGRHWQVTAAGRVLHLTRRVA